MAEIRCKDCGVVKPASAFQRLSNKSQSRSSAAPDLSSEHTRYRSVCKLCDTERRRLRSLGATLNETVRRQKSDICPICNEDKASNLDHDHTTGRIRGALCRGCNIALHKAEKPGWPDRAKEYLDGKFLGD